MLKVRSALLFVSPGSGAGQLGFLEFPLESGSLLLQGAQRSRKS